MSDDIDSVVAPNDGDDDMLPDTSNRGRARGVIDLGGRAAMRNPRT